MSPIEEITESIKKIAKNARIVKRAHFIAEERKRITHNVVGLTLIVFNLLITSSLIEAFYEDQADIIIKVFAFIAALLAGIQTFFNFEKNIVNHLVAGRRYTTLQHNAELLLASTQKSDASENEIWNEYKKLSDDYLQANTDFEAFVPSNRDYNKARAEIKKQE